MQGDVLINELHVTKAVDSIDSFKTDLFCSDMIGGPVKKNFSLNKISCEYLRAIKGLEKIELY